MSTSKGLRAAALGLAAAACGGGPPFEAPTPWEGGELRTGRITGSFHAAIGSPHPGAGRFDIRGESHGDLSRVAIHDVGSTWRVVQVQLLDRSPEGWTILELDVAENHWIAGPIPIDGSSAGGTLTLPDGSTSYLLRGQLTLVQPGLEDGQVVSGSFQDIDLVEVP